jgi:ankyrin repeat protein
MMESIDYRYPPLLLAAKKGDLAHLMRLFKAGADINRTDNDDYSALHVALLTNIENQKARIEVINFLIDNGIDVNIQDLNGRTALHYAIEQYNLTLIQKLLNHDANMHITDENGISPYGLALSKGSKVANILESAFTKYETTGHCFKKG